jgi:chromosome partitioning protein
MAKIFCIANQKGGVGKTTTTVNLAAGLAKVGQRVLMIDLDPQGNATMGSGIGQAPSLNSVSTTCCWSRLRSRRPGAKCKLLDAQCGYHILGANRELAGAEVEMVSLERREKRLKLRWPKWRRLRLRADRLPAQSVHAHPQRPVLCARGDCADAVRVLCARRLADLVNTIKQVHANLNRELRIIGLLRVMFDPRITLQQQVSQQLNARYRDKVFNTVIPRNVRLAEAPSYGLPGVVFDPASQGAQAFVAFAREMVERVQKCRQIGR